MTFKVGDKVRCIEKYTFDKLTIGKDYEIIDFMEQSCPIVINDNGNREWFYKSRFELVQEDKLPHSQTKKPIRSCEYNGSIYKEDTIDGVSIEDMKATRDNINSKLQTHRNLFFNPKK